jgi:hypothetical protein
MWTRKSSLILAVAAILGACGPGQVRVSAELEVADPEGGGTMLQPIADKEVQLVPFDRDLIFDSLTQAAPSAEPPIPDSVLQLIDEVQAAQAQWRAEDSRWATLRDSLKVISTATDRLDPASSEYARLFREFVDFEAEVTNLERTKEGLFAEFTSLQGRTGAVFRDLRLQREQWGDDAFEEYGVIVEARLRSRGRTIMADTTDAMGTVTVALPPGEWWVYARHTLPFQELYWNIPVVAIRGEVVEIRLTLATAQVRQTLR